VLRVVFTKKKAGRTYSVVKLTLKKIILKSI